MQNAQDASHTPSTEDLIAAILAAENEDNQLPLGDLLDWINGGGSDTLSANESEASGSTKVANGLASRKRTYEMRKEEKDMLAKELSYLRAKLDFLKHRAGIPDEQTIYQSKLEKALLREILRNQQYLIAGFKSNLAGDKSQHMLSPLATSIYLGTDLNQRQQLLNQIRPQQILHAKRFMEARTQFINPTMRFSESSRFRTENGDNYAAKLDVIPLPNATSVKQVYNTILFHLLNVDVSLAEKMVETVTLREKQDSGDGFASQHRVRCTNQDVDVEINAAVFARFVQSPLALTPPNASGGKTNSQDEGIVTTCFVDRDDLYPYCPQECVRQDITSIWKVARYPANITTSEAGGGHLQPTLQSNARPSYRASNTYMIVLKRSAQSKLHPGETKMPKHKLDNFADDSLWITNAVMSTVAAAFQSTSSQ